MQLDPTNEDSLQVYAQAEAALGETDQAIASWQQWLNAHPNDSRATSLLGTLEEVRGDDAKAMEYYRRTLQIVPDQALASNNLAYLLVETNGNMDMALSLAQAARRAMPDSPNTADTLAWVYYQKGTYTSARDLLEDAVKQDPNNASIHYHLGLTYSKLGEKSQASSELKKAVTLSPNSKTAKDASAALGQLGM